MDLEEVYVAIRRDTTSLCARHSCEKRYTLFLLAVIDYKRLDASLYFIINNFHTKIKPQVKVNHYETSVICTMHNIWLIMEKW